MAAMSYDFYLIVTCNDHI